MRFGLFFQAPESRGQTRTPSATPRCSSSSTLADSLGFDVAWLAELHFGGAFSLLSNPLMAVPVDRRSAPGASASGPPSPCCRSTIR